MAKMIPPYFPEDEIFENNKGGLEGEKKVYELLKNDPNTKNWIILHSFEIRRRIRTEIDFFVCAPDLGFFAIEVKSSKILGICGDNPKKWIYLINGNKVKKRNAFSQAESGILKLWEDITNYNPKFDRYLRGYGVILLNDNFVVNCPEYPRELIFDSNDINNQSISNFIKRLSLYFQKIYRNILPTIKEVEEVTNYLRPKYEIPTFVAMSDEIERIQANYTESQFRILDNIETNDRLLIYGGAGSGKTLMALELAKRALINKQKVFLTCYNKNLSAEMYKKINDFVRHKKIANDGVKISNFHKFLFDLMRNIDNNDLKKESEKKRKELKEDLYLKEYLPKAVVDLIDDKFEKFDYLIIDEGQDLIENENYLRVFDKILKNGLLEGKWAVFYDKDQAIFSKKLSKEDVAKKIEDFVYGRLVKISLKENCRNTEPIINKTVDLCELNREEIWEKIKILGGEEVEIYRYNNDDEQKNILLKILNSLTSIGIKRSKITILSPKIDCIADKIKTNFKMPLSNNIGDFRTKEDCITYFTIQSFKGLENSYIILTDLDKEIDYSLLYVAMTRAKIKLYIIHNNNFQVLK